MDRWYQQLTKPISHCFIPLLEKRSVVWNSVSNDQIPTLIYKFVGGQNGLFTILARRGRRSLLNWLVTREDLFTIFLELLGIVLVKNAWWLVLLVVLNLVSSVFLLQLRWASKLRLDIKCLKRVNDPRTIDPPPTCSEQPRSNCLRLSIFSPYFCGWGYYSRDFFIVDGSKRHTDYLSPVQCN